MGKGAKMCKISKLSTLFMDDPKLLTIVLRILKYAKKIITNITQIILDNTFYLTKVFLSVGSISLLNFDGLWPIQGNFVLKVAKLSRFGCFLHSNLEVLKIPYN